MNIQSAISKFPDFAKIWAEKRLTRLLNQTGSLPNEEVLISVKDYLSSLAPEDRIFRKLNKISWQDAVQLQKNWHDTLAAKSARMTEFEGDAEAKTFIDCENGYRWVRLETPEQLDFEGNAMGHCIGKGSYDKFKNHFYSLRDSKNLPHATVEFDPKNKRYLQIQGRANEPVIADYWEDAVKIFNVLGFENGPDKFTHGREYVCGDSKMYFKSEDIKRVINDTSIFIISAKIDNTSFGVTTEGKLLYLTEEPSEGTSFRTVKLTKDSNIREWKWNVSEDFNAFHSLLEIIANDVKFEGNVNIGGTRIKHWHNDVAGYFYAYNSLLETIADNVKFGGNVDIGRTRIKLWQHDAPGSFDAHDSLLETLAVNVKFGGNVDISGTRVRYWHHDVYGNFKAHASLLETVSTNVKFGGNVNICETRIKRWQHDVVGYFNANAALLETVSSNVKFGGNINIQKTGVKHWQHDAPGNFNAYGSLLETIADNVKFGGYVDIGCTRIKHWRHDVAGHFDAYNSSLETIAANVKFGGNVDIKGTKAKSSLTSN